MSTSLTTRTKPSRRLRSHLRFHLRFHRLPVRRLGFNDAPAIPVDLPGMVDTLVRLGVRKQQDQQNF